MQGDKSRWNCRKTVRRDGRDDGDDKNGTGCGHELTVTTVTIVAHQMRWDAMDTKGRNADAKPVALAFFR